MRTYVRAGKGDDPSCRPRRVLRVRRAARRPAPSRPPGHRRNGGRALGQLRGTRVRRPHRHGRPPGPPPVPTRDRRTAADVRVLRGEQGGVRGVRRHDPAGRGTVDRRGVPRRARAGAHLGLTARDCGAATERCRRARRPPDHRRSRPNEVPRQGGKRRGQARRTAGGAARRRARLSPSIAGRTALGCGTGNRRQAARARDQDRRPGRGDPRGGAGLHARRRVGTAPPCARPQP